MIIALDDKSPMIAPDAFVESSARVIGDVTLGSQASVWFNAVIRGDVHSIRIGERTNIQDNATIHVTAGRWPTEIGRGVTVGHAAVLHGCRLADGCLIGIGAVVLDGVEIGEECLVGAGALVTPGSRFEPRQLILGAPARAVRPLREEELQHLRNSAANYVAYADMYRKKARVVP